MKKFKIFLVCYGLMGVISILLGLGYISGREYVEVFILGPIMMITIGLVTLMNGILECLKYVV